MVNRIPAVVSVLVAATALALAATGASAQVASTAKSAQPSTVLTMAALGDSYSSGEGAGDYYPSSGSCHRSANAWAEQLHKYVNSSIGINLQATGFIACSGALSSSLNSPFKGQPAQLISLGIFAAQNPPNLVTMTIGGNDTNLGFASVLADCYLLKCAAAIARVKKDLPAEEKTLADDYTDLGKIVFPNARVLIIGYPLLFTAGTHDWCNGVFPFSGFSPAEQNDLDNLIIEVDNGIQQTVHSSDEGSIDYVSTLEALKGHTLCTKDPWIVDVGAWKNLTDSQEQGHPNAAGQTAMAKIIAAYISEFF